MYRRGPSILAFGLLALVLSGVAEAVTTLTPLKGSVYVQQPKKELWQTVSGPTTVEEGDRIKTGIDSRAFMLLPDGHKVAIGSETYLTLERIREGETKFFLKTGAVRNKVRKLQPELGQYYKIQTPSAVCAVRGTDFLTSFQNNQTHVNTFEGAVAFGKKEADAILVEAGRSARLGTGDVQMIRGPETSKASATETHNKESSEKEEEPGKPKSEADKRPEPKGPPPGGPGAGGLPPAPGGAQGTQGPHLDWDHPEHWGSKGTDPFNTPARPEGETAPLSQGPVPPRPPVSPTSAGPFPNTPFNPLSGTGFENRPLVNDPNRPPVVDQVNLPPAGNTGGTTFNPTQVGLDALVNTLNGQAFYDLAQAVQVADLYRMNAVKMDPLTGQLRQFADAVLRVGNDGIKFVNASMVPGQPGTLNFATAYTRFNTALPTGDSYTSATKIAFADPTSTLSAPAYYAQEYHSDMSNTVDHVFVDATNGNSVLDLGKGYYVTQFSNMQARISNPNGTTVLWTKNGGSTSYLGGAAPIRGFLNLPGRADREMRDNYSNGDWFSVHTTFSNGDSPSPASVADVPSGMNAGQYMDTLFVRTTLVSNLFMRGPITVFGSVRARTLAGMYSITPTDALNILNGLQTPDGAPTGLVPS